MNNIDRTDEHGYTIISEDEAVERFEDMLNDCFPLVQFGSLSEFLNWLDCEELTIDED